MTFRPNGQWAKPSLKGLQQMAFHQPATYSALLDVPFGTLWAFPDLGKHRRPQHPPPSRWAGCWPAPEVRGLLPVAAEPGPPCSPSPRLPPPWQGIMVLSCLKLQPKYRLTSVRIPGSPGNRSIPPCRPAGLGSAGAAGRWPRNLCPLELVWGWLAEKVGRNGARWEDVGVSVCWVEEENSNQRHSGVS